MKYWWIHPAESQRDNRSWFVGSQTTRRRISF